MATVKKAAGFSKENAEVLINYKDIALSKKGRIFINVLSGIFFVLSAISFANEFNFYVLKQAYFVESNLFVAIVSFILGVIVQMEKKISLVKTYKEK